jgi:hypothetical protein
MPTYLITNRITDSFRPGPEAFAAWTAWFESLGAHLQDRGTPRSPERRWATADPRPCSAATR